MDKKVLAAIGEDIVAKVMEKNGIEESEARALVGGLIRRLSAQIVEKIAPPTLTLA